MSPPIPEGGPSPTPHSKLGTFTPRRVTAQLVSERWMEVPETTRAGGAANEFRGRNRPINDRTKNVANRLNEFYFSAAFTGLRILGNHASLQRLCWVGVVPKQYH